ncbi:hypothetical protein CEXT_440321 [Caerostris extrusa]|uniref:Secreted protein n=1 Tax=Caerostris extrusa TaxID=172846 RepID=A0AAV4UK63_CAEEX|nr:hypothetical protein CEXT_440321 [Caerostris extrusa]
MINSIITLNCLKFYSLCIAFTAYVYRRSPFRSVWRRHVILIFSPVKIKKRKTAPSSKTSPRNEMTRLETTLASFPRRGTAQRNVSTE